MNLLPKSPVAESRDFDRSEYAGVSSVDVTSSPKSNRSSGLRYELASTCDIISPDDPNIAPLH